MDPEVCLWKNCGFILNAPEAWRNTCAGPMRQIKGEGMAEEKTLGIVVKTADYGENNRMLTLLTPQRGILSVSAAGVRKSGARLKLAAEPFTYGTYELFASPHRYRLIGFSLMDAYYPLRTDLTRLGEGALMLELCRAAMAPGEDLFRLLVEGLAYASYSAEIENLSAAFLARYLGVMGIFPQLERCIYCGKALGEKAYFSVLEGAVTCGCFLPADARPIRQGTLSALKLLAEGTRMDQIALPPAGREGAFRLMEQMVRAHLEAAAHAFDALSWTRE